MMLKLRPYIALFFLLIISVLIVPKELVHELYEHTDTQCVAHDIAHIEEPHQHCEILKLQIPPYISSLNVIAFDAPLASTVYVLNIPTLYQAVQFNLSPLRGPPLD